MKNYKKILALFIMTIVILISNHGSAFAIKITPPRLVVDPNTKVEHIYIKNNADKTESYRFGWKHMAMNKEGDVLNLDKIGLENAPAGYKPLDDLIRFSPRRVTLKSGQTQRVTFLINRSSQLEAGEYRSHFLIQREPQVKKNTQNNTAANNNSKASSPAVSIDVLISRAIPIYVLHGETNAELKLLNAEIKRNEQKKKPYHPDHLLHFRVQKQGNRSVIGIASVYCEKNGTKEKISKTSKTFAVYAEGEYRNEKVAITSPITGCSSYLLEIKGHHDDVLSGKTLIEHNF